MDNIIEIISNRRTRRFWKSGSVLDESVVRDIVACGILAPTGSNAQCTRFILSSDREILKSVVKDCLRRVENIPDVVIFVGYDLSVKGTINFQDKCDVWRPLQYQDVAASMQNMLLFAEYKGLSACWLSFFTKKRQELLQRIGVIKDGIFIISALAVGLRDDSISESILHGGRSVLKKDYAYYVRYI